MGERTLTLTPLEQTAWRGLQARYEALNAEQQEVIAAIIQRLGLAPGAIGTTHGIDVQTWRVVPVIQESV
jgi:hypothetical protein